MCYQKKECDIVTKYRILSKPDGLNNKDIRTITGCSASTASKIIQDIREGIAANTGSIIGRHIPADDFITYKRWNFDKIQKLAFAEIKATNN